MSTEKSDVTRRTCRGILSDIVISEHRPFRDYYQIGRGTEQDAADSEPQKQELKGHTEPSHSLFGVLGQIAMQSGLTVQYLLDKVNVVQLSLMMADAPHYVEKMKKDAAYYMNKMNNDKEGSSKGVDPLTFFTQFATKD